MHIRAPIISGRQIREAQKNFKRFNAFINVKEAPLGAESNTGNEFSKVQQPSLVWDDVKGLSGLEIAVKDNICTKDLPTTCGSYGLNNYTSPYDATVVSLLRDAGVFINGKTNLDEFGMGSHSVHSHFGPVRSPFGSRSAGGSSGGSAVAVASGQCHAALGTDTGGSVRLPAAYHGIYGFKPTYGRLSRWGVVAYANSLDTVGILVEHRPLLQHVFAKLDVYDKKDPTSMPNSTRQRINSIRSARKPGMLKFGVPEQYRVDEMSPIVRNAWARTLKFLTEIGHTVHAVSLPRTREALSAYYVLAPAEASSNLAKYDGVRYGSSSDSSTAQSGPLYAATRQQGFGDEVKRRILLGAYSLSANAIDNYFIQAQKIRRLVQDDFNKVFRLQNALSAEPTASELSDEQVDAIVCPTATTLPPRLDEVKQQAPLEAYAGDVLTVPASLAGLPSLNVPVAIDQDQLHDLPVDYDGVESVGMQVITQYGDDELAFQIGDILEPMRSAGPKGARTAMSEALGDGMLEGKADVQHPA